MRQAFGALILLALLLPRSALADDAATRLIGSWRLVSLQIRAVDEDVPPRDVFGPHPFGRLVLTTAHTMAAFISKPDRRPPATEAEASALLSSMVAYTGKFRLDGDQFITTVDGAWNEIYKAREQVRLFTIDGNTLSIRTGEGPSGVLPGKVTVGMAVWEREE